MKNNYKTIFKNTILTLALCFGMTTYAQDIHFTFENATITNEGGKDYYEVDILIQTINSTGSFKWSSGQLYFTYNTLAFGDNVSANSKIEFSYPDDYICGQGVDAAPGAKIYGVFTVNDNTDSRVSWACSQGFAASTFAADNITETPKKLFHMKIEYTDSGQLPMVMFEDGEVYDDQFYTGCGPFTSGNPFELADCGAHPGTQLLNDTFDSSEATLSIAEAVLESSKVEIYPNPTTNFININTALEVQNSIMYDLLGKQVLTTNNTKQIKVNHLQQGIYLLKVATNKGSIIKKIVIK